MANMTFKANLLPETDLGYSLGSSDLRWNIYGNVNGYVTLDTDQTITGGKTFSQPIYFETGGDTTRAILAYNASNLGFGITYKEGSPDVMTFSASGNANNLTGADLSINGLGNGILSHLGNYIPHTGNTTGTVGNSTTPTYVSSGTITAGYPYLRYINTNDATTWTADTLAATDSIAFTRVNITGAYTTGHIVWLNAKTIGTPFQLVIHDSSDLYLYKRYWISADSKYSAWTKMNAGYADSAGTATTCSYPLGFSGRSTNATWGNQTGATVTSWNESSGGSIDFRRDNPSSGKLSIKVDGRFYGNEGTYPAMLMNNTNSYWGMGDPDAASNVWIRTTSAGIIPYQSGGAGSGHCGLGTSSWYFSSCYVDNDYAVHQRSSGRAYAGEWIEFSAAANGLYWPNSVGGTHFYPNNATTYGSFIMQGAKGGYIGLTLGNSKDYLTLMSSGVHNGMYSEKNSEWVFYYHRDNKNCGIGTLGNAAYKLSVAGTVYSTGSPGFYNQVSAGTWSYLRLHNGSNYWDIATRSDQNSGCLDFRPGGSANIGPRIYTNGLVTVNNIGETSTGTYSEAAMQIREYHYGGSQTDTWGHAPRLTWHWSGRVAAQIGLASNGYLYEAPVTGTNWYKLVIENSGTYSINISGTAVQANYLTSTWISGGSAPDMVAPLQAAFPNAPKDKAIAYQINNGNRSTAIGYFLSGDSYNTVAKAYGGFFVCHYATPRYVGIANGTWKTSQLWKAGDAVTGAVWNDYAEYRETDVIELGRVCFENGDDTMSLSTKRLQKGCSITSDTWGFAQGETEKAKTPIAVSGRALAFPYENREEFKKHIGDAVCSGPNGTVSIMTDKEVNKYPLSIIGTISSVPDYEEWGGGENADRPSVKVNGRVWIRIR